MERALDAREAMENLGGGRFDVLLTDLNLPGLSGIELARQARAVQRDLYVVFASGEALEESAVGRFPHGMQRKPYTVDGLESALRAAHCGS